MRTTLHTYYFNTANEDERKEHEALLQKLKGRHWMHCTAVPGKDNEDCPAGEVELETDCFFSNQWNTACGHRVFDHYEGIYPNKDIKEGHYLDITPEMIALRENTHKCGYCGKLEPAAKGYVFCPHCLGSEYLKETKLHLLRMLPVADDWTVEREPLSEVELANLLPQYVEAQTFGVETRREAKRKEAEQAARDKLAHAMVEHDGLMMLLDWGLDTSNVLYYEHSGCFVFGWRKAVPNSVARKILEVISEFPFPYEIKGTERTWEGY